MGNYINNERLLLLLKALVNGNSERATSNIANVDRETVARYAMILGTKAQYLHNQMARGLTTPLIEQDELWSFVKKKQSRVSPAENAAGQGEAYTFVSLAMPSRYVVTWTVGKRDAETASIFEADTRARLSIMPEITTDGFNPYPLAIGEHFGPGVDYSQGIKRFRKGGRKDDDHRYEPPRDPFLVKHAIFGAPNLETATTAHVERNNSTMRHFIGRMRRLVLAFSKCPKHHRAAVALSYCYYNLCWIPKGLRVTPAMSIGVTAHPWDEEEFLNALLSVLETGLPEKGPLSLRQPATPSRLLANGHHLRSVPSAGEPKAPPPRPVTPPPDGAPSRAPAGSEKQTPGKGTSPQLDLFEPRAPSPAASKRPEPQQLSLFRNESEPPTQ
ncbi:IS1 transposase [Chondromyces apiculatus]|nr:IS1 transposase [Chondromyces apiculatus]